MFHASKPVRIRLLALGVVVAVLLTIGVNPQANTANAQTDPCRNIEVLGFMTDKAEYDVWEEATLIWAVANADQIHMRRADGEWEPISNMGFRKIPAAKGIDHRLRVTTPDGWTFETAARAGVIEQPYFWSAAFDPMYVAPGETAELKWEALYADYVVIESWPLDDDGPPFPTWEELQGRQHYPLAGSITVTLTEHMEYRLFAVDTQSKNWGSEYVNVRVVQ